MFTHRDEILCQWDALNIISSMHLEQVATLIQWHDGIIPVMFREIIDTYELLCNRVPTADELIGIVNRLLDIDVKEI